jgi:hypothetical protein
MAFAPRLENDDGDTLSRARVEAEEKSSIVSRGHCEHGHCGVGPDGRNRTGRGGEYALFSGNLPGKRPKVENFFLWGVSNFITMPNQPCDRLTTVRAGISPIERCSSGCVHGSMHE